METKAQVIEKFGKSFGNGANDTGHSAVQVALLTRRINKLIPHFSEHIHDYHSNRGLMKLVGQRRTLLKYLKKNDSKAYLALIKELGMRK